METSDRLTINCEDCLESIPTTIQALEDNYLICPECMGEIIVDAETLLMKRELILRKAQEYLDKDYGFDDDSTESFKFNT
jgi:hypothetical protein